MRDGYFDPDDYLVSGYEDVLAAVGRPGPRHYLPWEWSSYPNWEFQCLGPCPFCGRAVSVVDWPSSENPEKETLAIVCGDDGCELAIVDLFESRVGLVKRFNRRSFWCDPCPIGWSMEFLFDGPPNCRVGALPTMTACEAAA